MVVNIVLFHDTPLQGERSARVGWVVAENGCHVWQGGCNTGGYGQVRVAGRKRLVHRVRYEMEVGLIPDGMVLDHFACDNGAGGCCNPLHCRPVTRRENTLRGDTAAARQAARTHCPLGHPLTGDNLARSELARGHRKCRECDRAQSAARRAVRSEGK